MGLSLSVTACIELVSFYASALDRFIARGAFNRVTVGVEEREMTRAAECVRSAECDDKLDLAGGVQSSVRVNRDDHERDRDPGFVDLAPGAVAGSGIVRRIRRRGLQFAAVGFYDGAVFGETEHRWKRTEVRRRERAVPGSDD